MPPSEIGDTELAERAKRDPEAFGVLYDRYAVAVYRYCFRRADDREAAEDATSRTFLRAMEHLPTYRGGSFRAWLFAIAHSAVVDGIRTRRHLPLDAASEIVDVTDSPEAIALDRESARRLGALLTGLPDDQRRVIDLRLAGFSGAEIAEAMGRSVAAVKMLQLRAMRTLRVAAGATIEPLQEG